MRSEADLVNPPPIRIPSPPSRINCGEIRPYVTSESRHIIDALHTILSNLDLADAGGPQRGICRGTQAYSQAAHSGSGKLRSDSSPCPRAAKVTNNSD